ncbi:MAG: Protein translocase subunit SecD [Candidatus Magasanikbacteria bacterium GW2011_GWA2_56_11]|uniref:Protein translocase subunit SecD n=1 Tax=Candidatus Magasanikbacteria bacterium GW2011_GWA2_56_11 TaxID=1619044 RepID=A0A0G1YDY6_9BACT|nr:MAG: Protein translocase subunit SecD [Candidatus Magasanikbacteria bacterium GW2011_GWA2_56_11]
MCAENSAGEFSEYSLDLQGGVQLIYEADVRDIPAADQAASVEGVRDVVERRVSGMGVGEPTVQTSQVGESYRLNVELPGVTDIGQAIKMIGETPILEFKEENREPPRDLTAEEKADLDKFNQEAKKRAEEILARAKKGEDFAALSREFSAHEESKNNGGYIGFVGPLSLEPELYDVAAKTPPQGVAKSLVETSRGYDILKRGGERDGEPQAKARHILICYLGSRNCSGEQQYTKEEARQKAADLYNQANAANFAELAEKNSTDSGSKSQGGDLGWLSRGQLSSAFADALFSAKKGEIIGPVETEFGWHVIFKEDERISREYEVSRILVRTKTAEDYVPSASEWKTTGLSGKQLERAEVVSDPQTGAVQVSLKFNGEGADLFKDLTERNIGAPIAIFLDGEAISIPTVNTVIADGNAVISGNFTITEARLLAQRLNAGALPVPVELISQQAIGATLGAESLATSLKAGVIGALLIMIFMILIYRLPGLISVVSLCLYIAFTLAIFKLIGVTITLAGIAGFLMSLGVAVDANVLIFERLKEELRHGKSLRTAIEEGFLRAWTSIRDGNASTLITCAILIWFGTSFVKGFAITLAIGILVSLFTAITVTRVILRFVSAWFADYSGGWLFLGGKRDRS